MGDNASVGQENVRNLCVFVSMCCELKHVLKIKPIFFLNFFVRKQPALFREIYILTVSGHLSQKRAGFFA